MGDVIVLLRGKQKESLEKVAFPKFTMFLLVGILLFYPFGVYYKMTCHYMLSKMYDKRIQSAHTYLLSILSVLMCPCPITSYHIH